MQLMLTALTALMHGIDEPLIELMPRALIALMNLWLLFPSERGLCYPSFDSCCDYAMLWLIELALTLAEILQIALETGTRVY